MTLVNLDIFNKAYPLLMPFDIDMIIIQVAV